MRSLVFVLAVGCGTTTPGTDPMGGDDDMPPPPPPPPPPTLTVTVIDGSVPQPGVPVVFQHVDGSVAADLVTDANGVASFELDAGTVSVIRAPVGTGPAQVFSYVGAKLGDHLALGRPTSPTGTPTPVTITLPVDVQNVTIKTPCGTGTGSSPSATLQLDGCPTATVFYVADNGQQKDFAEILPVTPAIDFAHERVYQRLGSTLSATLLPTDGSTTTVEGRLLLADFQVFSTGPKDPATPQTVRYPALADAHVVTVVTVATAASTQQIASRHIYPSIDFLEVTPSMLPYVTAPTVDAAGSIAWTETPAGTATEPADVVVAAVDVKPATGAAYKRMIAAPYGGTTLAIPALPPTHAELNPATGDTVTANPGLVRVTGGYDEIRPRVFALYAGGTGGGAGTSVTLATVPMDGLITLSFAGTKAP